MAATLPYVFTPTALTKVLEKIKAAAVPHRFSQNFLSDTLGLKGGNYQLLIPYLKKIGFLSGDGAPTELYKKFRNDTLSKRAVAEALHVGYAPLFTMNEAAHKLPDSELSGLIVQATGLSSESRAVSAILQCFKLLKGIADFSEPPAATSKALVEKAAEPPKLQNTEQTASTGLSQGSADTGVGLNLSYTINLQLPATTDVNVFNAIFRSLKENLLKR
jgi:hypothetical protein